MYAQFSTLQYRILYRILLNSTLKWNLLFNTRKKVNYAYTSNFILNRVPRSRNGREFVPKKWEYLDKIYLAENMVKMLTVKIYNISILYWDKFFQVLYASDFWVSLASAFWCQNCLHYNLENGIFDLEKTLKINWNFMVNKSEPCDKIATEICDCQWNVSKT